MPDGSPPTTSRRCSRYLGDPLDTTELVIEWGSQRRTKAFSDALAAAGADVVSTAPPSRARDRGAWVADEAAKVGVRMTSSAIDRSSPISART